MVLGARVGRVAGTILSLTAVGLAAGCRGPAPGGVESSPVPAASIAATDASPVAPPPASDAEIEAAIAAVEEPRTSRERLDTPAEMMLYADTKRFLAIQAAAAQTEGYERPHDLASLARLIRKGELQPMPELGSGYVLDGVGEDANENPLAHYDEESGFEVPLVGDPAEVEPVAAGLAASKRAADQARAALIRKLYASPDSRAMLAEEYDAITSLAKDFEGESYDLGDHDDREALQGRMSSSLRPAAREVVLELASKYHAQFGRPLPVVSMVRTERYQKLLSRVNRNATRIDVAPHTTGQAFDVTYRYMPTDEQNFLMAAIAELESAGKVEALRENRNCFHVFAFATAHPPGEPAIASARAEIVAERAAEEPERTKRKPRKARTRTAAHRR